MITKSFLGTGWSFPPQFNKTLATVEMTSDEADVQSSLYILLSTRPGERVLRSKYGCNLDEMLFEPLTTTFISYIKDLIQTAILYYEPRITLNNVQIFQDQITEGVILIELDYTIKSTNSRFNFVYPFYKAESTLNR